MKDFKIFKDEQLLKYLIIKKDFLKLRKEPGSTSQVDTTVEFKSPEYNAMIENDILNAVNQIYTRFQRPWDGQEWQISQAAEELHALGPRVIPYLMADLTTWKPERDPEFYKGNGSLLAYQEAARKALLLFNKEVIPYVPFALQYEGLSYLVSLILLELDDQRIGPLA